MTKRLNEYCTNSEPLLVDCIAVDYNITPASPWMPGQVFDLKPTGLRFKSSVLRALFFLSIYSMILAKTLTKPMPPPKKKIPELVETALYIRISCSHTSMPGQNIKRTNPILCSQKKQVQTGQKPAKEFPWQRVGGGSAHNKGRVEKKGVILIRSRLFSDLYWWVLWQWWGMEGEKERVGARGGTRGARGELLIPSSQTLRGRRWRGVFHAKLLYLRVAPVF